MKFLGQHFVPAAVVPSLFHGLSAGGAKIIFLPQQPTSNAFGTDESSGVSRFR